MKSKFKIETKIDKNKPFLTIFLEYKDSFTDDKFTIHGFLNNVENINFSLYKKNQKISDLKLENKKYDIFLKEVFNLIDDFDFKEDFEKNNKNNFIYEVSSFINEIDSSIIVENKIIKAIKIK